ncbi:MAG: IS607 family transposase [Polyangiales bacterium]
MDGRIKLSQAAKVLGMSFRQAQRHAYEGKIPTIISETGRRFVPVSWLRGQTGEAPNAGSRCAIYSRESSSENKSALASQTDGLRRFAQAKGWSLVHVVEEFGSGVNDQRKKLRRLLERKDFDVLLVEHKDRLTRFGFAWFEAICPFRIEVVNRAEDKTNDLMDDLVAILTSFSARLYGQRRGRKKTEAAIAALKD